MKMIKTFGELNRTDANTAGGKGASLGEMTNAGIPVPPGFVVLSGAFEYFIRETGIVSEIEATLKKVNHKEMESVERASEIIRDIIEGALMPKDLEKEILDAYKTLGAEWVAVRSSATAEDGAEHAWAGQLDSFLNTSENDLIRNVQRCFSSLFTPRAIFYRFEKGLHNTHITVAVVVQKMVQSEKSGIAFSVHPVTEDHNQMIIEGSWGLGEAIVSGQVTPDSYVVTKKPQEILDTSIAEKTRGLFKTESGSNEWKDIENKKANEQCLSGKEILELGDLIMKIENHYGFPCDIEWAYEKKKFYIVQSRPITTLQNKSAHITYFPNGVIQMGQWALSPLDTECWNSEITQKRFKDKFGLEREMIIIHKINPLYQLPFYSKDFFRKLDLRIANLYKSAPKKLEKELLKFYTEVEKAKKEVHQMKKKNLKSLSNQKLIEVFKKNRKLVGEITVYDQFGWLSENTLTQGVYAILKSKGLEEGSGQFNDFLFKLTKPKHISTTLKEKLAVYKSALVCRSKPQMLEKSSNLLASQFGFMPIFSYGNPWYSTHYEKELKQVMNLPVNDIKRMIAELKNYAKQQQKDFIATKKKLKLSPSEIQRFVDFGLALDARNEAEYFVSFAGEHLIKIVPEVAQRLKCSVDKVSLLFIEEICECLSGSLNIDDILKNRIRFTAVGFLEGVKRVSFGNDEVAKILEDFEVRKSWIQGNEDSNGKCGSPGKAEGRVKICKTPDEINKVKQGDVLITYATTVDYLPAMKLASAIVTEVGGITCHAAVVSREFGIPCVIGLKNAMKNFKDGDMVEVDADKGIVKVISETPIIPDLNGTTIEQKKKDKYHFHFKCSDTPLCVTELAWTALSGYGKFEYLYIQEADLLTAYCTSKGVRDQYTFGQENLLNKSKFNKVIQKIKKVDSHLKSFKFKKPHNKDRKIVCREWLDYFKKSISLLKKVGSVYFVMEVMVLEPLAEQVDKIAIKYNLTQDAILHNPNLLKDATQEEKMLVRNLQILGDWKFKLHQHIEPVLNCILLLIDFISDTLDIPKSKAMMLRSKDIVNILRDREIDWMSLCKRENGGVFIIKDGRINFFSGKKYLKIKSEAEPEFEGEIVGTVAFRGVARGKATIHLGWINTTEVPEGNILIAGMTNPQMVPYIRSASAIVTDEGGLTCHAAIIAREMKIPCVVGTKVATRVIKDGDLVEVDAEKGVVRILKRA